MNKRPPSISIGNSELDQTFRFDSRASFRPSKTNKSRVLSNSEINLDFSQRTSQLVRFAEGRNENILELLEESDEDKRTQKVTEEKNKNELWNFFARFENESNPDITISEIEFPTKKDNKGGRNQTFRQRSRNPSLKREDESPQTTYHRQMQPVNPISQISYGISNGVDNSRYPRRNRVHALRFWLGQKCIYKHGKMVNVIKIEPK